MLPHACCSSMALASCHCPSRQPARYAKKWAQTQRSNNRLLHLRREILVNYCYVHWVKIEYLDVVGTMRERSQQLQVNLALIRQSRLLFLTYLNSRGYIMTLRACSQTKVTLLLRYDRSTDGIPSSSAKKLRTLFTVHSGFSSPTFPSALSQE